MPLRVGDKVRFTRNWSNHRRGDEVYVDEEPSASGECTVVPYIGSNDFTFAAVTILEKVEDADK